MKPSCIMYRLNYIGLGFDPWSLKLIYEYIESAWVSKY